MDIRYQNQGQLSEAEAMLIDILHINERVYGVDSPAVAQVLDLFEPFYYYKKSVHNLLICPLSCRYKAALRVYSNFHRCSNCMALRLRLFWLKTTHNETPALLCQHSLHLNFHPCACRVGIPQHAVAMCNCQYGFLAVSLLKILPASLSHFFSVYSL